MGVTSFNIFLSLMSQLLGRLRQKEAHLEPEVQGKIAKTKMAGMVVHTFDSTAQAHLCEFEVSLVSIASSRATQQDSVSKASKWGEARCQG